MFIAFISATFPVFAIAAIGYLLSQRTDLMKHPGLNKLVTQIALPALILNSIVTFDVDLAEMLRLVSATAVCIALGAVLTYFICRLRGIDPSFYISTLVNPNTGNFGIPLISALLGDAALAGAVIISTAVGLSHWTLGVVAMTGRFELKGLFRNIPLWALLLGAVITTADLSLPEPVINVLGMLAGLALPIMLMLLGHSLAQLNFKQHSELSTLCALSLYRPITGALIALIVVQFVGLESLNSLALVMQMSMPVAVMSYLLALKYAGPADRIAALTLTSMPVSLAVLALLYVYGPSLVGLI